jgi:hypothetical protein
MTDIRAGDDLGLEDEDRLPWLEPVEEEDQRGGPSAVKILVSVVIGLIILGLVISGVYWLRTGSSGPAGPQLIEAEKGDYKVKPADPGGMQVEGSGETSFAASEGAQTTGKLNMDAVSEAPVERPPAPAPAPPAAKAPPPKAAAPAPKPAPPPAPTPVASGPSIQLGAFNSTAIANSAWKSLSTRFKYLEALSHNVTSATVNGRTFYRLRASGPDAKALCNRLRVAGESCIPVN